MENYWKSNKVETFPEEEVFHLTEKECRRCRYKIIDHSTGDAECYVHHGNHGVRLFPKHLWNIVDGRVYYRPAQDQPWSLWSADIAANIKRPRDKEDVL
jgi:hypothetical protein